jgi:hypothetical protein
MQAPTHFLFGILIADIFRTIFPDLPIWAIALMTIPLAFGSHFLIDAFAIFTYHPPKADWKDPFWVSYHLIILVLTIVGLVYFWNAYWWAMIAATLVDIVDWLILRAILKKPPRLHQYCDKLRTFLFKNVPNLNHTHWTIVVEFVIIGLLLTGIFLI